MWFTLDSEHQSFHWNSIMGTTIVNNKTTEIGCSRTRPLLDMFSPAISPISPWTDSGDKNKSFFVIKPFTLFLRIALILRYLLHQINFSWSYPSLPPSFSHQSWPYKDWTREQLKHSFCWTMHPDRPEIILPKTGKRSEADLTNETHSRTLKLCH